MTWWAPTPLAEKLDPEEFREVILAYQEVCAAEIRHFEGYLARYIGDGLLVYFGYPQAHEDDAPRAVRAGLGIVAALPQLNQRLHPIGRAQHAVSLQVRIGIHTGLVVVGDMGGGGFRDPMAIVGETPNIAARLQGIAEPNTVVISGATHRLVQGLFECQTLGPRELKGVTTRANASKSGWCCRSGLLLDSLPYRSLSHRRRKQWYISWWCVPTVTGIRW